MKSKEKIPERGEDIYIPTSLYLSHGMDDFSGGLCRIIKIEEGISAGEKTSFIEVAERPGYKYNLEYLLENQKEWKKEYGKKKGFRDPDYRPQFNEWD